MFFLDRSVRARIFWPSNHKNVCRTASEHIFFYSKREQLILSMIDSCYEHTHFHFRIKSVQNKKFKNSLTCEMETCSTKQRMIAASVWGNYFSFITLPLSFHLFEIPQNAHRRSRESTVRIQYIHITHTHTTHSQRSVNVNECETWNRSKCTFSLEMKTDAEQVTRCRTMDDDCVNNGRHSAHKMCVLYGLFIPPLPLSTWGTC